MSVVDETGGGGGARDTVLVGDGPVVPVVEIPPNEDLGLSPATVAAVEAAAMNHQEEALDQTGAAASEEELRLPIEEKAPELLETSTVVTTVTTTTTITEIESTEIHMEPAVQETTVLGKREEREEEGLGLTGEDAAVEGESGPPIKKIKESTDGEQELGVATVPDANAAAKGKEGEKCGLGEGVLEPVKLGPKTFHSGVEMFTYFYDLLHAWVSNVDVNKYEYLVLSELIKKGHRDAESKIGKGIQSFQIRFHPGWHSRCYYLIRTDGTIDDFSYRKCVDKIMPLPENLYSSSGDLLVDQLLGPGDANRWSKKNKGKDSFGDGWKSNHGGQSNRGGRRGGRGGRRGNGRGGGWTR